MYSNTTTFKKFRSLTVGLMVTVSLLCSSIPVARAEAPLPSETQTIIVDGLTQEQRAQMITDFFVSKGNLPLKDYGMAFVKAADEHGLDWRLVASIGFIESTGGKFACRNRDGSLKYNAFGWGGCTKSFDSYEQAIERITLHLSGNHESTDQYYEGKTLKQVIDTYNPPTVRADYYKLITGTMKKIHDTQKLATN